MPILVFCLTCQEERSVGDDWSGQEVKCLHCGEVIAVPPQMGTAAADEEIRPGNPQPPAPLTEGQEPRPPAPQSPALDREQTEARARWERKLAEKRERLKEVGHLILTNRVEGKRKKKAAAPPTADAAPAPPEAPPDSLAQPTQGQGSEAAKEINPARLEKIQQRKNKLHVVGDHLIQISRGEGRRRKKKHSAKSESAAPPPVPNPQEPLAQPTTDQSPVPAKEIDPARLERFVERKHRLQEVGQQLVQGGLDRRKKKKKKQETPSEGMVPLVPVPAPPEAPAQPGQGAGQEPAKEIAPSRLERIERRKNKLHEVGNLILTDRREGKRKKKGPLSASAAAPPMPEHQDPSAPAPTHPQPQSSKARDPARLEKIEEQKNKLHEVGSLLVQGTSSEGGRRKKRKKKGQRLLLGLVVSGALVTSVVVFAMSLWDEEANKDSTPVATLPSASPQMHTFAPARPAVPGSVASTPLDPIRLPEDPAAPTSSRLRVEPIAAANQGAGGGPFVNQRKLVGPRHEWIREISSWRGGTISFRVLSSGPFTVSVFTHRGHTTIQSGARGAVEKEDVLLQVDSQESFLERKVKLLPGSTWFYIENRTAQPAEIHLQCFDQ